MITHFYLCFSSGQGMSDADVQHLLEEDTSSLSRQGSHQDSFGNMDTGQHRNSVITWVHTDRSYEMLKSFITIANDMCGWHYDVSQIEGLQVATYKSGQHYDWHIDGDSEHWAARKLVPASHEPTLFLNQTKDSSLEGLVRKLSIIIQLSDPEDYEGGDIYLARPPKDGRLDTEGETLPQFRQKGSVIVFPSYVRHKVTPVTKGVRKSAVAWICGPPFK